MNPTKLAPDIKNVTLIWNIPADQTSLEEREKSACFSNTSSSLACLTCAIYMQYVLMGAVVCVVKNKWWNEIYRNKCSTCFGEDGSFCLLSIAEMVPIVSFHCTNAMCYYYHPTVMEAAGIATPSGILDDSRVRVVRSIPYSTVARPKFLKHKKSLQLATLPVSIKKAT